MYKHWICRKNASTAQSSAISSWTEKNPINDVSFILSCDGDFAPRQHFIEIENRCADNRVKPCSSSSTFSSTFS